jgi:predicted KAP-like P-loop ATPase
MPLVLDLLATPERPVVVFVDDLDRCSSSTVTQVIEGINLFLAGGFPNCIFIIAMEPDLVAAHINTSYKDVIQALSNDGQRADGSLGWRFLEKMVQLPLSVPHVGTEQAGGYIDAILRRADRVPEAIDPDLVDRLEKSIRRSGRSVGEIRAAALAAERDVLGSAAEDEVQPETVLAAERAFAESFR